ncbi:MAG: DUF4252 domain-containing protein [Janthinobacterium lividum]
MTQHFSNSRYHTGRLLFGAVLLALAFLVGCRASGPGSPARSVAAFFDKYHDQSGFHATEWSAGLLQRLALVKVGKLLGGSDLTNAITGVRTARALSFAPTSSSARDLVQQGLLSEATGLLQAERYTTLVAGSSTASSYNTVIKASGDKVSEIVGTGALPSVTGSFVLVQVQGNFTRTQAEALARVLPELVKQTGQ